MGVLSILYFDRELEKTKVVKRQTNSIKQYINSTFNKITNLSDINDMQEILKRYYNNYDINVVKEEMKNKDKFLVTLTITSLGVEYYKNVYIVQR